VKAQLFGCVKYIFTSKSTHLHSAPPRPAPRAPATKGCPIPDINELSCDELILRQGWEDLDLSPSPKHDHRLGGCLWDHVFPFSPSSFDAALLLSLH